MNKTFKNWRKEAEELYYEEWYKRIYKSIIHNENILKRLETEEGKDAVGRDNVNITIAKAERTILDEEADLTWLEELLKDKK